MRNKPEFYKRYMIVKYEDYYAVYHPDPNSISFPLCRVDSVEEARKRVDEHLDSGK